MKKIVFLLIIVCSTAIKAQVSNADVERFPVFSNCENLQSKALETCFYNQVQDFVFNTFQVPENLKQNNYKGSVIVLFEVVLRFFELLPIRPHQPL